MSKVPLNLQNEPLSKYLADNGFRRIHQGKVRDTHIISDSLLLLVAYDRLSIFDFVLNVLIPKKGEVLTALTHFWAKVLNIRTHLEYSDIKEGANAALDLRASLLEDLPVERCLVVENYSGRMYPFEMIYRHHIGGSVYGKYLETGKAGGHDLPKGLPKWSKLDKPIFTPSTKEEIGHDINIDAEYFFKKMEEEGKGDESYSVVEMCSLAYEKAYSYAENKGILILDTKLEVAGLVISDEILTPDSSCFCSKEDWEQAMKEGRDPHFLDKEPFREWGRKIETPFFYKKDGRRVIGLNNLDPENPVHVEFVHGLKVPEELIKAGTDRYLQIFEMLTGMPLLVYQKEEMFV